MGKSSDLADVVAIMDDAQAFQLMVVETVIVRVIERRGEELRAAERICRGAVLYLFKGDEQAPLVHANCLDGEFVFLLSLAAMEHLVHREADFGLVGGGFDAQLAFDSVRFDDTADH